MLKTLATVAAVSVLAACVNIPSMAPITPAAVQLSPAVPATMTGTCAELGPKLAQLADTSISRVNTIGAGVVRVGGLDIAEHCQVLGRTASRTGIDGKAYAIAFEMRLPRAWNGRFYHQGNGGIDGNVVPAFGGLGGGPSTNALYQGFATLSSDAGHQGANPAFGADPQARLDYGYQAVAKLTPMAKAVVAIAYGKGPDRSYFGGCSNGGRHAMIAATRYPDDYDGILAGAPGYNLPKAAVANLAGARLYKSLATTTPAPASTTAADLATGFTDAERRMLAGRILAKCDALDGAADGMVQDLAACQSAFNLNADVPTCAASRDGTCLSAAQKTVITTIFTGPKTSDGTSMYTSFPYDAGVSGGSSERSPTPPGLPTGVAFWEFYAALNLDAGSTGIIFKVPPESPLGFNGPTFSLTTNLDELYAGIFATNATFTESAVSFMTPPNPADMSALAKRGGRIIAYHGNSDAIFSVTDTETWFKALSANMGEKVDNFARFYRVPGMGHCSGGPSADQFDMLTPLVKWVETGLAPASVAATVRGPGNAGGVNPEVPRDWAANRSRPLCPYPQVARYSGQGSVDTAASFSCR